MRRSDTKPNRLDMHGDSLQSKLPSPSRKKRKRRASKKRRAQLKAEDARDVHDS
jgi:hypothetical protein